MPTRVVARMQLTLRGRNALLNIFELWVGLAGILSGIVFFYSPASIDHNAIAQVVGHGFAETWSVGYMGAGFIIWWGLLRPNAKWEVAGLWLLGSATAVNGLAITETFGLRGLPTSATLVALSAASWARALYVQHATLRLAEESQSNGLR